MENARNNFGTSINTFHLKIGQDTYINIKRM